MIQIHIKCVYWRNIPGEIIEQNVLLYFKKYHLFGIRELTYNNFAINTTKNVYIF